MKKVFYFAMVLFLGTVLTITVSCSENNDWANSWYLANLLNNGSKTHGPSDPDDPSDPEVIDGLISFAHSGCKSTAETRGDDEHHIVFPPESVKYEGTEDGYLLLEHINAIFSCEATITATATVADGVITIVETAPSLTNCVCTYDLSMKIGPLENKTYDVVVNNRIAFRIEYSTNVKGEANNTHFPDTYVNNLVDKSELPECLVALPSLIRTLDCV